MLNLNPERGVGERRGRGRERSRAAGHCMNEKTGISRQVIRKGSLPLGRHSPGMVWQVDQEINVDPLTPSKPVLAQCQPSPLSRAAIFNLIHLMAHMN